MTGNKSAESRAVGLKYIVMEYLPSEMGSYRECPARIDGHYRSRKDAEGVARLWAETAGKSESRIVVAEIVVDVKAPKHWEAGQ